MVENILYDTISGGERGRANYKESIERLKSIRRNAQRITAESKNKAIEVLKKKLSERQTRPKLITGRTSLTGYQTPIPEVERKGFQNTPPVNPYRPPQETEINSMDGIYRPFTLGERGTTLDKNTIFDSDDDSRKRRRSMWLNEK